MLQWNVRSLRSRLPDLRQHLLTNKIDILALQEPRILLEDCRLGPYVIYLSASKRNDGKSRAALFVRARIHQEPLDLSSIAKGAAENVGVTVRSRGELFSIISVYVPPNVCWDPEELREIKNVSTGHLVICGDFNAHNEQWGDRQTTRRGIQLEIVTSSLQLQALNDGTETFVRPGVKQSVLDLTFASPNITAEWNAQPDTWGSDHVPIIITSPRPPTPMYKEVRVTNWDAFRAHMEGHVVNLAGDPSSAIAHAVSLATKTIRVPITRPSPDLTYLKLRAARRRAQRRARRTNDPADWIRHRQLDAAFRRHTSRLQRHQWDQLCSSFGSASGISRAWKMAQTLSSRKMPTHPIAGLAIAIGHTMQETAEILADAFATPIPLPPGYQSGKESSANSRSWPPFALDSDFTISELEFALRRCRRKSAPGPDGVTYQALRNLDRSQYSAILEAFNAIWRTAEIPEAWLTSTVVPIRKPGKPAQSLDSYRPISLTSCVGKLMERLVLRRLTWYMETIGALPDELCGFRAKRCTADAIGDLASTLEEARASHQTVYCVFLDIHKAFDALPHATIRQRLRHFGITGRLYSYVCAFLTRRCFFVRVPGAVSSRRSVTQGVPQGSVLSPFLFNLAMAALPFSLKTLPKSPAALHIAIYADDAALWCVGPSRASKSIGSQLQRALDEVVKTTEDLGLTLSVTKTAFLCYRPNETPSRPVANAPKIGNIPLQHVTTQRYLGVLIDNHVTWRPEAKRLLIQCRQLMGVLRCFRRRNSGLSPQGLLALYRGLILSRILYAVPLLNLGRPQIEQLEQFHRCALRLCLGLPRFSENVATLVEARENPISLHKRKRAMRHLVRLQDASSTTSLLSKLRSRPLSCLGAVTIEFEDQIGPPKRRFPPTPPHTTLPPLNVTGTLPFFQRKSSVAPIVARSLAMDLLDRWYKGWLHVFTDGSTKPETATSTAAFLIPSMAVHQAGRLNFHTTSTTAELVAICKALEALLVLEPQAAVILTDSRSALCHLENLEDAPPLAQEAAHVARKVEAKGWRLAFQWIPSHCGIKGNEQVDSLAAKAHGQETPEYFIPRFSEAKRLVHLITRMGHPHDGVASGNAPPPLPESKLSRKESSLLHRLRAGCPFTAKTLHKISRKNSPNCDSCGTLEDTEHVLWSCPKYGSARTVLHTALQTSRTPVTTPRQLMFPNGGKRLAEHTFRALLEFLEASGLATRL